jgi:hypothetical protein
MANPESQWSVGTFGGIAEYVRDSDEAGHERLHEAFGIAEVGHGKERAHQMSAAHVRGVIRLPCPLPTARGLAACTRSGALPPLGRRRRFAFFGLMAGERLQDRRNGSFTAAP